ncbi:MAG: DUF86 domain-containing protein [Kiritimatiellia bacterium]|nr:DUF86 domain-containing protein [Kiritimatiellia bacterium]
MRSEDKIRLRHILDEAGEAIRFIEGISFEDFTKDSKTVHAVFRAIELIGEAAAKISGECKELYPDIPWTDIVGMRNHLIHVYFDVDYETVWKTVKTDIPKLIQIIEPLLKDVKE